MPTKRRRLDIPLLFTDSEAQQMVGGHIPDDMDDKWFIYFENGWLHFHRSWTGHCIYNLRLDGSPAGVRIAEAWVNGDKSEYNSPGEDTDIRLIEQLIRNRLLS